MTVLYNYIINYLLRTAFFSRGPWFILFFIRKELDIGVFSIPHGSIKNNNFYSTWDGVQTVKFGVLLPTTA